MINKKWCDPRNISILSRSCSPRLEHLSIICRPFYLPREFSSIVVTAIWQALQEHDGKNWETEEELLPSGHQAPKLKLGLITFTGLNLINCKTLIILHHPHCCYVYIPGTTCLHILLAHPCLYYYLLSPQYTVLHILFYCTFYSLLFLLIFILF